jgi:probable HAF family extracellular repeat protein
MKLTHVFETRTLGTFIGAAVCSLVLAAPASAQIYSAHKIDTLGGPGTYASDLNESGHVTGNSDTGIVGQAHAFVTQANGLGISDLGTLPGGNKSQGMGINANGQVTGISEVAWGIAGSIMPQAFIADIKGGIKPVTGWVQSGGIGINNAGQVTGYINNPEHVSGNSGGDAFVTGPNGMNALEIGGFGTSSRICQVLFHFPPRIHYQFQSRERT